jgi:putative RNA 2'-phosphotransferase
MPRHNDPRRLGKMLRYILGRRPDEFGLVLDPQGFVRMKTLLQVLQEEEGWRHVRLGLLQEAVWSQPDSGIETQGADIRALHREAAPRRQPALELPKLLYLSVRRRSHAQALEKGLPVTDPPGYLVLSLDATMAQRIGRRRDPAPVLITVRTACAQAAGVSLQHAGDQLVLSGPLPRTCLEIPPLPKMRELSPPPERPRERPAHPGSVMRSLEETAQAAEGPHAAPKDRSTWKRERRRSRRMKERLRFGED